MNIADATADQLQAYTFVSFSNYAHLYNSGARMMPVPEMKVVAPQWQYMLLKPFFTIGQCEPFCQDDSGNYIANANYFNESGSVYTRLYINSAFSALSTPNNSFVVKMAAEPQWCGLNMNFLPLTSIPSISATKKVYQ